MKKLIIRTLASRHLLWYLSVVGSLFLTKELLWDAILIWFNDGQGEEAKYFVYKLSTNLLYFGFFFFIIFIAFRVTHADDLVRKLTLKVIRDPQDYFIFLHRFILHRFHTNSTFKSPLQFFDDVDNLLEIGQRLLGLHHKRSLLFLLGIEYAQFKRSLHSLHHELADITRDQDPTSQAARELINDRIKETKEKLEMSLILPLQYLETKSSVIQNSYLNNLSFLASLAAQPSYDPRFRRGWNCKNVLRER